MQTHQIQLTSITSLPSDDAWTQVYHAGTLTSLLVLHRNHTDNDNALSLAHTGKQIIHTLETDFFSLQTKTLTTIKKVIADILSEQSDTIAYLAVVVTGQNLHVYSYGEGGIILLRNQSAGKIAGASTSLLALNGKLEPGDRMIIASQPFFDTVPLEHLSREMGQPTITGDDFTENYTTRIHEADLPEAAGVFIQFPLAPEEEELVEEDTEEEPEKPPLQSVRPQQTEEVPQSEENHDDTATHESLSRFRPKRNFSHRRKLLITITLLVLATFCVSIFLYHIHQSTQKYDTLYQTSVAPLQKQLQDAQAIASVNPSQATDQMMQIKQKLQNSLSEFPKQSVQYTQTQTLLTKATNALSQIGAISLSQPANPSPLLHQMQSDPSIVGGFEDDQYTYTLTSNSLIRMDKQTQSQKTLIQNSSSLSGAKALSVYNNNIYVLTAQDIVKFVPSSASYSHNSYFAKSQDMSKATSIAIDSNIWVGMTGGTIQEYTRGNLDNFTLTSSMQKPQEIDFLFTTVNGNELYALDKKQSLFFVINKNGQVEKATFIPQIQSVQSATLLPDGSAIQVLVGGTIYQISL